MKTHLTATALVAVLLAACGPLDIDITTTGGSVDGGREPDDTGTTTGNLSVSETGTPTGTTGDASGSEGGSSSTGEGSSDGSSSSGPPSDCVLDPASWQCMCNDVPSHPSLCDCVGDLPGWCTCPEGSIEQECPGACFVEDGVCECWDLPADPLQCGCALDPVLNACVCNDHGVYPPETCEIEPLCGLVLDATGTPQCMCDGALSDPALCGCEGAGLPGCACEGVSCGECESVGALCLCGKFAAPPESCESR
jgi:hypothetical protein